MANQELIDYITRQRVHGAGLSNIKFALISAGWDEADVDQGIKDTEPKISPVDAPVVKVDGAPSGTGPEGLVAAPAVAEKSHLGLIIALIGGIVLILAALGFVYLRYLRPSAIAPSPVVANATTTLVDDSSIPVDQPVATTSDVFPPQPTSTPDAATSVPGEATTTSNVVLNASNTNTVDPLPTFTAPQLDKLKAELADYFCPKMDVGGKITPASDADIAFLNKVLLSDLGVDAKLVKDNFASMGILLNSQISNAIAGAEAGCSVKQPTVGIEEVRKQYVAAVRAGTPSKIVSFYIESARSRLLPQIQKSTKADLQAHAKDVEAAVLVSSDRSRVEYKIENSTNENGPFVFVNINGKWLIQK